MPTHPPLTPLRFSRSRVATVACLVGLAFAALAPTLLADPLQCDLSNYSAARGLTATVERDVLTVTWTGTANSELRARYAIDRGQPLIRELAARAVGREWAVLGENLAPDFTVQTGRRRIDFAGLAPLKALGVDTASREVIERQADRKSVV